MDIESKYSVDYQSLENGHGSFGFTVDGGLFAAMESNEIKDGRCDVRVELERSESMMTADVAIAGTVVVECDRCLDDCEVPVEFHGTLTVRFSDTLREYDGEQLWIGRGEQLSLAQYIYESIVISLPYRRVHPEGGCDPDMMARFTPAEELPDE